MTPRRLLALAALALPLASCQTLLQVLSAAGFQRPTAAYQSSKLETITLDDATVAATFAIQNPNTVGLDVQGITYAFSLDGQKLFDGQLPGGLHLAPHAESPLVVPVRVPFEAVPDLLTTLATKDVAPYSVQATLTVRTPVGDLALPVGWSGELPLPKMPKVKVAGAKLHNLTFTGARFTVTLAVENPNVFPVPLDALEGAIQVAGLNVAKLGLGAPKPLAAKSTATVELPVDVSFANAGLAVSTALAQQNASVGVQGQASFAGRKVPLNLSGALR